VLDLHTSYGFVPNLAAFRDMYFLKNEFAFLQSPALAYGSIVIWQLQLLKSLGQLSNYWVSFENLAGPVYPLSARLPLQCSNLIMELQSFKAKGFREERNIQKVFLALIASLYGFLQYSN
jgi:hypothetical protein